MTAPERLFVAICLPDTVKAAIGAVTERLRREAVSGSFSPDENLHLTLAFLGETTRRAGILAAMKAVRVPPFSVTLRGLGRFVRREGNICWIGAEETGPLLALHKRLREALSAQGFPPEQRPYRPHLTLGRGVTLPPDRWEALAKLEDQWQVPVTKISLMESCRVGGAVAYREVAARKLEEST